MSRDIALNLALACVSQRRRRERNIIKKVGFTLIELAISLVIIGLLVGGILEGSSLIEASRIRAQIGQFEKLTAAANTFKMKYDAYPGDISPTQTVQLGFFTFTGTYAGKSCLTRANGNNDGMVSFTSESYPFWRHLSQAKLIKGDYGGSTVNPLKTDASSCSSGYSAKAGTPTTVLVTDDDFSLFAPRAEFGSRKFVMLVENTIDYQIGGKNFLNAPSQNMFFLQEKGGNVGMSAYDSYRFDSKIDDGLPTSGRIRNWYSGEAFGSGSPVSSPPCTTASASPIEYDLSSATANSINCFTVFFW